MALALAQELIARGKVGRLTVLRIDPMKFVRFDLGEVVLRCECECGRAVWIEDADLAEAVEPECAPCARERKLAARRDEYAKAKARARVEAREKKRPRRPAHRRRPGSLPAIIETELERKVMLHIQATRAASTIETALALSKSKADVVATLATLRVKRLIRRVERAKSGRGGHPARYGVAKRGREAMAALASTEAAMVAA